MRAVAAARMGDAGLAGVEVGCRYSAFIPARRTTSPQRVISDLMNAANSSGVSVAAIAPSVARRACISGEPMILRVSAFS